MALKAGYYGVKKSLIDLVKALASSVIVKDVGDGLEYDEETGELSAEIKSIGDGLELDENGELAATGKSTEYAVTEFDTGEKWINGGAIKGKIYKVKANQLQESTVTSQIVKGHIYTDLDMSNYEAMWIDLAHSFIYANNRSDAPLSTPLEFYATNGYVRINLQQVANKNDGNVTAYFDTTYACPMLTDSTKDNYILVTILYAEKVSS